MESMNDFHSLNFKHIFDQLDATNFNQWQNLTFRSAQIYYQLFKHWFAHNSPVCSDEGLTLETSAKHHIPQATNIPYQPWLIKPIFNAIKSTQVPSGQLKSKRVNPSPLRQRMFTKGNTSPCKSAQIQASPYKSMWGHALQQVKANPHKSVQVSGSPSKSTQVNGNSY